MAPATDSSAYERLTRVMNVRRRQFAMRIVVAAVIAGLFFGFTGWLFATIWFAAYLGLQLLELKLFDTTNMRASLDSPLRYRAALWLLACNTFVFGVFGVQEAVGGGAWGLVCACLLWAGSIMNSVVASNGSSDAFIYQTIPSALFYLTTVFSLSVGATWLEAGAVVMAGALNLMVGVTVWGASQRLYEAELAARRELERKTAEAEAATAAKSVFVAMVSHELRTPISAILAGAAEVERTAADPALRSNGLLIADSARMMRTLLNDLLDLSKIEAGAMGVELIPYDARGLVRDMIRFWSKETAKKGLRVRLQGSASLPRWVTGDPTRLRQILNNLFSNAIKFTDQGSVTLDISAAATADGAVSVTFQVIDTGPGMSEAQLGRLFIAFEQLGESTARTHGGTGLGLAISRDLARLMGGDILASSVEGHGATFSLTLPLSLCEAAASQSVAVAQTAADTDLPLRVLIADDHEFNRRAFTLMLEAASAEITAVEDGVKALEALCSTAFDVVLMDVNMPRMGGLEVVRRLRASTGPNAQAPVIALTAAGGAEDIAACMAAGMDAFVTKPVESTELFAAIDRVLSERAPEADLALSA